MSTTTVPHDLHRKLIAAFMDPCEIDMIDLARRCAITLSTLAAWAKSAQAADTINTFAELFTARANLLATKYLGQAVTTLNTLASTPNPSDPTASPAVHARYRETARKAATEIKRTAERRKSEVG